MAIESFSCHQVNNTLRWPVGAEEGESQKRTILQGAGLLHSVIRVPDGSSAFSGTEPKAVIWTRVQPGPTFWTLGQILPVSPILREPCNGRSIPGQKRFISRAVRDFDSTERC